MKCYSRYLITIPRCNNQWVDADEDHFTRINYPGLFRILIIF